MATELTVEAVRDFIIIHDGKVKNNVLVTHFRKFLNDPSRKVESRQIFKDCVNEVAVVKTEHGEKYVQLKKKYRTGAPLKAPDSPIEVKSPDSLRHSPTQDHLVSSFDTPISHQQRRPSGTSLPRELPPPYTEHDMPPPYQPVQNTPPKRQSTPSQPHPDKSPPKTILSQRDSNQTQVDPTVSLPGQAKQPKRSTEANSGYKQPQMDSSGTFKIPHPPGNERKSTPDQTPKHTSQLSDARLSHAGSQGSLDRVSRVRSTFANNNDDNISIMQSEASIDSNLNNDFDDDRGSSTFAMDPIEKQWMLWCARGSMLELRKLLNTDPNLVEKRDFVFGYTGLHWAAKKGSEDLVRMLADTGIDVNILSNGGYTPMHLAAMHGHDKVVQILLEEYQADPSIRNYSGKQARDYLKSGIALPMQKLMFGNDGNSSLRDFAAGLRPRLDSVRKSKRIGSAISGGMGVLVGTLVRGKATSNEDISSNASNSPHVTRKGSFSVKGKKKDKKHRKNSKDERPSISLVSPSDDSEFGFGPRSNSVVGELPRPGKSSPVQVKKRSRGDSVIPKSGSYDGFGSYR